MKRPDTERVAIWQQRVLVVTPAAIVLAFAESLGYLAAISQGSWPHNATGVFFGLVFSDGVGIASLAYGIFLGLMLLYDKCGSQSLGVELAWVRAKLAWVLARIRTMPVRDILFWIWVVFGISLVPTVAFSDWRAAPIALLCLLIVFLVACLAARLIGAIKSPLRQALVLMLIALLMGPYWGFYRPKFWVEIDCQGDGELTLRTGERLTCTTWKFVEGRKFLILVQGPAAITLVWPDDIDPASRRNVLGY